MLHKPLRWTKSLRFQLTLWSLATTAVLLLIASVLCYSLIRSALLPLALGLGAGAALQKPLAIAVIGGLSVSTLFTLIVAPVLYVTLEGLTKKHNPASEPTPAQAPTLAQLHPTPKREGEEH